MNIETLANTIETNRNFVNNCHRVANNGGARQFANMEAGKASYEAKMAFLESITSDAAVLPERAKALKELQVEQKEIQTALEMIAEQDKRREERLKFNKTVAETKNIKSLDNE